MGHSCSIRFAGSHLVRTFGGLFVRSHFRRTCFARTFDGLASLALICYSLREESLRSHFWRPFFARTFDGLASLALIFYSLREESPRSHFGCLFSLALLTDSLRSHSYSIRLAIPHQPIRESLHCLIAKPLDCLDAGSLDRSIARSQKKTRRRNQ